MILASLLDVVGDWDLTMWLLFGGLIAAFVAYHFWPESRGTAESEVSRDEQTRKQAKPLIAVASEQADEQLFTLTPMPMTIKVGDRLKTDVDAGKTLDEALVKESLWIQQRLMITRLESEFDYSQQADISDHFAIAAPANQPGILLTNTLKDLEVMLQKIRGLLGIAEDRRLWHGRAMILMLSTRKLFDHVAWLTGAGLAQSAPGAFMLAGGDVVMISIYATRVELFGAEDDERAKKQNVQFMDGLETKPGRQAVKSVFEASCGRPLLVQVCRAAIRCLGGEKTPMWVEYGLAHWMADQMIDKAKLPEGEKPVQWEDAGKVIFDADAWTKAADDSTKLEQLVAWSATYVNRFSKEISRNLLGSLGNLRFATDGKAAELLQDMMGNETVKMHA